MQLHTRKNRLQITQPQLITTVLVAVAAVETTQPNAILIKKIIM